MTDLQYEFLVAGYLRIAALSVAVYEYLSTLPLVWRIYKGHWTNRRVTMSSISIVLLFFLRLTSMLAISFGSFVFFHRNFTLQSCGRFYILAPTFRAMQTSVSQAILGYRAFNLSKRSTYVTYTLIAAYLMACPLQWATILFGRKPSLGTYWANCRAAVVTPFVGVWMSYAIAIGYDLLATVICLWSLIRLKGEYPFISNFVTIMICDGLGYFLALTGINITNTIIFYHNSEFEAAGAPLGCCITMIVSQRLLTHAHTCRYRYLNGCKAETEVSSRDVLDTSQSGSLRSQSSNISKDMA